jgi:ribonuclease P/MRP protein subunit RPP40
MSADSATHTKFIGYSVYGSAPVRRSRVTLVDALELFMLTGSQTDVIYIDFSKAIDSIVTSKLLVKLEMYGITGQLLAWTFLTNRTQRVVVDYCFSPECDVISGVPQGTVLGPILFLIYINDIEHVCCGETKLQLFADDV